MSQGHKTTAVRLLDALIAGGSWMTRDALQAAANCSQLAVDNALADLVTEQKVTWRENVGYRLAGTAVCRRAAQLMRAKGKKAAVVGMQHKGQYLVGVAETRAELGLVMYELSMPMPEPGPEALTRHLEQVGGVMKFFDQLEANRG